MCFKPKLQHELFNILGGNLQKVDATSQKDEGYEDLQRCFSTPSSQGNLFKGIDNKIVQFAYICFLLNNTQFIRKQNGF